MWNWKQFWVGITIALLILAPNTLAQTCALQSTQTANQTACLDLVQLSGDTLQVPSNTTRFDRDGLQLCPLVTRSGNPPAVLFLIDHSPSMKLRVPNASMPDGDPFQKRAEMVRRAISYLHSTSGGGWFGVVEFAGTIDEIQSSNDCPDGLNTGADGKLLSQSFLPLSDSIVDVWTDIAGPVQNRCSGGTNYRDPLARAKEIIRDFQGGDYAADMAVVMISDGKPNRPNSSYATAAKALAEDYSIPGPFPPIHGVFLGREGDDGDILAQLSNATGGTYNLVEPSDTLGMAQVMDQIIETIVRRSEPTSVTLRANGIDYPSSSVADASGQNHQIIFPADIPLRDGYNQLSMTIRYVDSTGTPRNQTTSFTLDVSAPKAPAGVQKVDSQFQVSCQSGNSISIGSLVNPILLPGTGSAKTPRIDPDSVQTLAVVLRPARPLGDTMWVDWISSAKGTSVPLRLLLDKKDSSYRGSVESSKLAAFDTIAVRWQHPQDTRDTLRASFMLHSLPVLAFDSDSLFIDAISLSLFDATRQGSTAPVALLWGNGTTLGTRRLDRAFGAGSYASSFDMQQELSARTDPRLVASYIDPVFSETYSDTAWLVFAVAKMPVVSLFDKDGNGMPELLELRFAEAMVKGQEWGTMKLIWGDQAQDTLFLGAEPDTRVSTLVWQWDLGKAIPFGHTSGPQPNGSGTLAVTGLLDGNAISRNLPALDAVAPVLLDAWVDAQQLDVTYLRFSETLAELVDSDVLLVLGSEGMYTRRQAVSLDTGTAGIYTLVTEKIPFNHIQGGDSAKLVQELQGGVRDLAGNGAHPDNPAVLVKGYREPKDGIKVRFLSNLVSYSPDQPELPMQIARDSLAVVKTQDFDESALAGSMVLDLDIVVPRVNGLDSSGSHFEGLLVDGQLAWETAVRVTMFVYDQSGQFVVRKTASYIFDDPSNIAADGKVGIRLLWTPESGQGLVDGRGRKLGSGAYVVRVEAKAVSTARIDLDLYGADGLPGAGSIRKGDKRSESRRFVSVQGYRR